MSISKISNKAEFEAAKARLRELLAKSHVLYDENRTLDEQSPEFREIETEIDNWLDLLDEFEAALDEKR